MAKLEGITEEKLDAATSDLSEVISLLHSIADDLLQSKIADGTFDGRDVLTQLAVKRAGQLVESVGRSLGDPGFMDDEWLPAPKSLRQA